MCSNNNIASMCKHCGVIKTLQLLFGNQDPTVCIMQQCRFGVELSLCLSNNKKRSFRNFAIHYRVDKQ